MTTVPRRTKPQPRSARPAAPAFSETSAEPWPSFCNPEPRVTTSGKVSSLPSPIQAMWAEAVGRAKGSKLGFGEVEGLVVAISILSCREIEDVRNEVAERADVSVSRLLGGS